MTITILCVFAFVFFTLAALRVPEHPRFSFGWGGAAFVMLAFLISHWPK